MCAPRQYISRDTKFNEQLGILPWTQKKLGDFTSKPSETRRINRAIKTKLDKQNALIAPFHFTFLFPIRKLRLVRKETVPSY